MIVKDNFATDAEQVRQIVISTGFSTQVGPDGATYTGISLHPVPQWFDLIAKLVDKPITPKLSCFRLNLEGEMPHSWVHSDDICAKYASVLYLNTPEQCKGGTAFWKHKTLGIDRLPSKEELAEKQTNWEVFYKNVEQEWKKQQVWEQINFMPMAWNRFISYPTCLFHSRYPFEAFGKGPEDGRLIWICFYDVQGEVTV